MILHFLLFLSFATTNEGPALAKERLDFRRILYQPSHSSSPLNAAFHNLEIGKSKLDYMRGSVPGKELDKVVGVFRALRPEIQEALKLDPQTKFRFIVALGHDKNEIVQLKASEAIELVRSYNPNTAIENLAIEPELHERLKNAIAGAFDQTSRSDIHWGIGRLVVSGTAATISFYLGDFTLPVAAFLGYGLIGNASMNIGFFLEKFVGWLEHNKVPEKIPLTQRLGSLETSLLLFPLLNGFSQTGFFNLDAMGLAFGVAGASALIQNVYLSIKKRSPTAAMWYKWYALEVAFASTPGIALAMMGMPAADLIAAVTVAYTSSLLATVTQGLWEILLTKIRRPLLEKAIAKDLALMVVKISDSRNVLSLRPSDWKDIHDMDDLMRTTGGLFHHLINMSESEINEYKKSHFKAHENIVLRRFKKYFFGASVVSVASVMALNAGALTDTAGLQTFGMAGLALLGGSGLLTWSYIKISPYIIKLKNWTYVKISSYSAAIKQRLLVQKLTTETSAASCRNSLFRQN